MSDADAIASVVLHEFDNLPSRRKPSIRDNGVHEWVPLSGIVARSMFYWMDNVLFLRD